MPASKPFYPKQTCLLQYSDTRKNLGTSASTKWILPVEGTGLAKEVSTRFQKKNT
jgi:hypothetical protein